MKKRNWLTKGSSSLLKAHAIEYHTTMVRREEPGIPFVIKGKLLDESAFLPGHAIFTEKMNNTDARWIKNHLTT